MTGEACVAAAVVEIAVSGFQDDAALAYGRRGHAKVRPVGLQRFLVLDFPVVAALAVFLVAAVVAFLLIAVFFFLAVFLVLVFLVFFFALLVLANLPFQ